ASGFSGLAKPWISPWLRNRSKAWAAAWSVGIAGETRTSWVSARRGRGDSKLGLVSIVGGGCNLSVLGLLVRRRRDACLGAPSAAAERPFAVGPAAIGLEFAALILMETVPRAQAG
ncbi:MAG TPA: hypothetical protein DCP85_13645, partial [Elusimicrobia bacterium]|nr:hypothetical protein [Elusimicrobiota bacterium]